MVRIPSCKQQGSARLNELPIIDLLIGFSAGAAAVWGISGSLAEILSGKPTVTVHKTPYLHGFMNRVSPNFNQTGYDVWLDRLR
jgi:hypothetical protein